MERYSFMLVYSATDTNDAQRQWERERKRVRASKCVDYLLNQRKSKIIIIIIITIRMTNKENFLSFSFIG